MLNRQQLRRFTWLALFAMLGLALAPTISRALSAFDSERAHRSSFAAATADALCGERAGAVGNGTAGEHDPLSHCSMCGVAAAAWSVAPAASAVASAPQETARQGPAAAASAPRSAAVSRAHPPRGPPAFA